MKEEAKHATGFVGLGGDSRSSHGVRALHVSIDTPDETRIIYKECCAVVRFDKSKFRWSVTVLFKVSGYNLNVMHDREWLREYLRVDALKNVLSLGVRSNEPGIVNVPLAMMTG